MPRGVKKEDKTQLIDDLALEVKKTNDRIDNLVGLMEAIANNLPKEKVEVKGVQSMDPVTIKDMIPTTWREKVNQILGPEFGAEVLNSSGGDYILKVIVPAEYDRRVSPKSYGNVPDHSTGLIRRTSDVADVTTWCERIKSTIIQKYPNFKK